jgi:hypothetical protein
VLEEAFWIVGKEEISNNLISRKWNLTIGIGSVPGRWKRRDDCVKANLGTSRRGRFV